MSHFSTIVFHARGQDINDLLAPYDENLEVAPYVDTSLKNYLEKRKDKVKRFGIIEVTERYKRHYAHFDKDGNGLTTYNPNSRYDYYDVTGGSWKLHTRSGEYVSECKVSDLDWSEDSKRKEHAKRFWEVYVDGEELNANEDPDDFVSYFKPEYFRNMFQTKERYMSYDSIPQVYAAVLPDGRWFEDKTDSADWILNYKKDFLDKLPGDTIATLLDCHI